MQHVFFDLDDTLTPSRSPMKSEHEPLFEKLCKQADVIIVTGARDTQIRNQIPKKFDGLYYTLSQQGNYCTAKDGTVLWNEVMGEKQTAAVLAFAKLIHDDAALKVKDENDLIEHRGCQISYSMIGQHEDLAIKRAFDPDGSKRKAYLVKCAAEVNKLMEEGVEVTVGGTTNFDFFQAGRNKGFNVARLIEHEGWQKKDCLYLGDALEPGRNDETVIGVVPTHAVKDCDDTFVFIQSDLLK